jgi:hypothetical protein
MGNFMAEIDTGRPQVTNWTYEAAKSNSTQRLELFAHCWPAKSRTGAKIKRFNAEETLPWKSAGYLVFPPFDTLIGEHLRGQLCIEMDIQTDKSRLPLTGYVYFDDPLYRQEDSEIPPSLVCVVVYTETVQHIKSEATGFGYYFVVVGEMVLRGELQRLGIGVAVSRTDVIPTGLLGSRKAPTRSIVLI